MARNQLAPVTLLAVFVLVTGVPLIAVGWLGWRLLDQERALDAQRLRERLGDAAALTARELDRSLGAWNNLLIPASKGDSVQVPEGAVLLVFDLDGGVRQQGVRLPYYPKVPAHSAPPTNFAAAERLEFLTQDLPKAAVEYRAMTASRESSVRAGALMRLARVLRKQRKLPEALAAYGELADLGETPVGGAPAVLVARRERLVLLEATGSDKATHERQLLSTMLFDGRLLIDRPTFEFYRQSLAGVHTPEGSRETLDLARAVEELWPLWHHETGGRAAWTSQDSAFASVWRRTFSGGAAIVSPLGGLMAFTRTIPRSGDVNFALEDKSGRLSWGAPVDDQSSVTLTARETDLPWTIHAALADPTATRSMGIPRRNVLAAAFAVMLLGLTGASYFVFRAVRRELDVARLQADFVAAVSHEFRTPLTAMCHLTEMLEDGNTAADRRPLYYRALARESRRLRAMVESLLDFGRIDAGRRDYHFLDTDAAEIVEQVVRECRDYAPAAANRIEWRAPSGRPDDHTHIRADREALALALRNLLDNAAKYSPESSPVRVSVTTHGGFVGISIEDEGIGIPKAEHRVIFRKFVRGSSARALNVKGTGIGLSMAEQIVKAHGGRLELESEPGRGSRFTAVIPVLAAQT